MTGPEILVGRYELREVLGLGGMAEVRGGWDTRLDRAVAIKLLHPALRAQPEVRGRFEAEARSAAALTHPNVVAVHDYGEDDGVPFIVMERLPGRTLADVIAAGPMSPAQVRSMLDEVLAALEVAHAAGVLHRDIKPGNILLSADANSLKVADFGIAKTGGAAAHTMTGHIIGTLAYMSPERVAGAPASVADDLYAVGVMAYEALLARPAFPQDNPAAIARAIMDDPPPPVTAFRGDVDPVLAAVIARAMARDPQQRFGSAGQMRAALAGAVPVTPPPRPATRVMPAPLPMTVAPARRRSMRTRVALAAAAIVAAVVVAVLAIALAADPRTSAPAQTPVGTSTPVAPPPPPSTTPPPPTTAPQEVAPIVEQPPPPGHKNPKGNPGKGNNGRGNGNGKRD
ncbi:serine/threonine-protein kinase [Mycobacterium sp. GA-2829]|uniref:serine/threonine-protein kinase n=1 Tax=Mycobacterium sp. GA-2829 TaxID=1772283 RepID=UPI00073FDB03|nr:serine/threonine-protein kinase [Mycobacterium sp. GA-2829]KUI26274.1 protein kinase [Mycobacterium sp. GA-2829]